MSEMQITKDKFDKALVQLSEAISQDRSIPKSHLPLKLVATGGFVSLFCLDLRTATEDLDYWFPGLVNEDGEAQWLEDTEAALQQNIRVVAGILGLSELWANAAMVGFVQGDDEKENLRRTMQQNVVLYSSSAITIYAASWTLQLVLKLSAITLRDKANDVADAVHIARKIRDAKGTTIKTSELRAEFPNPDRMGDVRLHAVEVVNVQCRAWFGEDAIDINDM